MGITSDYSPGQLFFSNSLENLFEKLKENLFPTGSTPFSKRLLVVPSQEMEKWIRLRLAQELDIAAGITTSFLDQAIHELFEMEPFPSKLALLLKIEYELSSIQDKWEPLKRYIRGKERRLFSLAKQLATLFIRYGIYGNRACEEWEREPKNWQEELWKRVFKRWSYPLRMLPKLKKKTTSASIHLFCFSHIPPLYFHFFQQLSSVYFYQLSPCQEFWSDLSTEHPLLTHFGRVKREMARLIEESELLTEELYTVPKGKSQLNELQRELLFLEKSEKKKDDSLQLHISLTEHHEIQNLRQTLLTLLQDVSLEPKEILVMAPNIAHYEPYIRTYFGDSLPYQIADLSMRHHHPQIEGLFLLLSLEKRRFSAPALLELFHHPLFQKKIGWKEEELLQIRNWIESTGIRWGLDKENRDALLRKGHCKAGIEDEGATWKGGIDHLLEELAIPYQPCRIDFTQAELLGEWKEVIDRLGVTFSRLHERLNLREWVERLKEVHTMYFSESDTVVHHLEELARTGSFLKEHAYSFETVFQFLQEAIGKKSITIHSHHIQAVRFCSLLSMRAIPAKVICLLGMNHDAFPRKENLFSLDLIKDQGDYTPSRLDFDRNLFLEAILSAREKLIVSYLGCDPYDQTPWPPSSVVSELLPYISKTVKHPVTLPIKEKKDVPSLFLYQPVKLDIPPCQIDLVDFVRPFRSPLRHYLYHHDIFIKEESPLQGEEAFYLSALRRAILRQQGESALKRARREGDFPIGPFGHLAEQQLREEIASLPKNLAASSVDLLVGNVRLVGKLDGILTDELCIFEKKTGRAAVRNWPLFLVYTAVNPKARSLLFARDEKRVERFFDDPMPYLEKAIRYYFLSKMLPTPLFPEWVEPILRNDPVKLEKALSYDTTLRWALRGQPSLPAKELIAAWKKETETLFKELFDAWF